MHCDRVMHADPNAGETTKKNAMMNPRRFITTSPLALPAWRAATQDHQTPTCLVLTAYPELGQSTPWPYKFGSSALFAVRPRRTSALRCRATRGFPADSSLHHWLCAARPQARTV